ncbi:MAG: hypothetical protein B6U88_01935 [Candidatus Aenigmarchaeota archaeon ex4484_56]|nr:MAG: hypothetical protein B6U88_01935 [Candidatus Aenigmarchaeota archaeon ex4484_56]
MVEDKKETMKDGMEAFYSNNLAVFHNPTEFILDFTQITPRIDIVGGKQIVSYITKHNAVVLEPTQAKIFLKLLKENIDKYEKKYGKIKIPEGEKSERKSLSKKFADYIG